MQFKRQTLEKVKRDVEIQYSVKHFVFYKLVMMILLSVLSLYLNSSYMIRYHIKAKKQRVKSLQMPVVKCSCLFTVGYDFKNAGFPFIS